MADQEPPIPSSIRGYVPPSSRAFHLREGVFFDGHDANLADGVVRITIFEDAKCERIIKQFEVTAEEWASVVAAVSAQGENGKTHAKAERFHREDPDA